MRIHLVLVLFTYYFKPSFGRWKECHEINDILSLEESVKNPSTPFLSSLTHTEPTSDAQFKDLFRN